MSKMVAVSFLVVGVVFIIAGIGLFPKQNNTVLKNMEMMFYFDKETGYLN